MALPDLASPADLSARNMPTAAPAPTMLKVASSVVRAAAGSPILQKTTTLELTGRWDEEYLELPGLPIVSVTSVKVDGQAVTDYRLDGHRLWRAGGFGGQLAMATVEVTYIHGLPEVPPFVVDLVCALVGAGVNAAAEGGYESSDPRVIAEKIDDYSVTFAAGAERVASVMELPAGTRRWLRRSFGGGAGMVTHR
ncbi:hypothetical protein [Kribbella sp. CA-293567]|uniref:hypothetical protein n=1 Tax=Kribbella sp. CA-293567 TaxID=3002436 RepID=UPI0022DE3084|nr:hypothetical protein [Kribbella sp. CA-293567]WBQ03018.1 hypothetical protein OX958_23910 [Kribbella sp. CA-293567]